MHKEIVKLKSVLRQNGYPARFLDEIISKFLEKSFKKRVTITIVPEKTLRLVLPYLGTQSLRLNKRLNKLFKEQLPSGKLKMVFRTTQRMSSCFRFIEAIPCSLLSGIIYEYKCPRCNSRYIVSTYRYWEKRLEEHLHISSLMDKPLKHSVHWGINPPSKTPPPPLFLAKPPPLKFPLFRQSLLLCWFFMNPPP